MRAIAKPQRPSHVTHTPLFIPYPETDYCFRGRRANRLGIPRGRRFTDSEWQQMRSRLLQFANLLHQWEYLRFSRKAAIAQPAWNEAA
jgi:hypothetical protein